MPHKTESFAEQFKRKSKQLRQETPPLTDPVNKALDRELDAQFNLMAYAEDVVLVSINQLRSYAQHPFKAYGDEKMDALVESTRRVLRREINEGLIREKNESKSLDEPR